jgi:hypothetical protein
VLGAEVRWFRTRYGSGDVTGTQTNVALGFEF